MSYTPIAESPKIKLIPHVEWGEYWSEARANRELHHFTYYVAEITEINGGVEYGSKFLIKCPVNEDIHDVSNKILHNYRGEIEEGEEPPMDDGNFIWFGDGLAAINYVDFQEISIEEFLVLKKYLSVL